MKINTYAVNCNDAWLNTEGDDTSGSYVKYKDHQEVVSALEAKCAALAAESAALKEVIEAVRGVADQSSGISGWHLNGNIATWEEVLPEINEIETPAPKAFLAEVRAQGVDLVCDYHRARCEALHDVDRNGSQRHGAALCDAIDIAAQLRQEAAK